MPNFNNWLTSSERLTEPNRALDVARRIAEHPTSITVVSRVSGGALPAVQTVRLEQASGTGSALDEREGANLAVSLDTVMVLGYKNAAGFTDTDLKRGDRFVVTGRNASYEVVNIVETMTDRLLAAARIIA